MPPVTPSLLHVKKMVANWNRNLKFISQLPHFFSLHILREDEAYSRHPGSLYRVFVRLGSRKVESQIQMYIL